MSILGDYKRMVEAPAIRSYEATIRSQRAPIAALEKALEPFAAFAQNNTDDEGWAGLCCQGERIRDWFGPSEFRAAKALLPDCTGEAK